MRGSWRTDVLFLSPVSKIFSSPPPIPQRNLPFLKEGREDKIFHISLPSQNFYTPPLMFFVCYSSECLYRSGEMRIIESTMILFYQSNFFLVFSTIFTKWLMPSVDETVFVVVPVPTSFSHAHFHKLYLISSCNLRWN